ncbi:MAG: DUF3500 domain-containing protein [Planctomycetota bacterium]|nr:DUF3500 domain-containing protein [Planctomycetota bacterium]
MNRIFPTAILVGFLAWAAPTGAQESPAAKKPLQSMDSPEIAAEMSETAQRFLAAIEKDMKERWLNARFHFKDTERLNFHFFPIPRRGVSLNELREGQKQLAYALMGSALSHSGNRKALTIMSLGDYLRDHDENPNQFRDSDRFFITIFGEPGPRETWAFRIEGFHLSLNITIVQGRYISVTPSFFGVIPAILPEGEPRAGLQALKKETELGRQLARSFSAKQRQVGFGEVPIFEETVGGLVTGNRRKLERGKPQGLAYREMNPKQQDLLLELVVEHVGRIRRELSDQDLEKIRKAGLDRIHFKWAGGLQVDEPHHYLIQGPTFLIEYDNTQDKANHVHCVYRDFDNDFGDAMIKHYQHHHAR